MAKKEIEKFKSLLEKSHYTVALCGSGMMEEGGALVIRADERAFVCLVRLILGQAAKQVMLIIHLVYFEVHQ